VRTLAFDAMIFARQVHQDQRRKYTGAPYSDHLAEVAGIAMSAGWHDATIHPDKLMAVCWLHDSVEDQGVLLQTILERFGSDVAYGVSMLSDMETGNRAQRKAASRIRLGAAPSWVQTIKCADLISNSSSIVQHDPKFALVYLEEKRLLLDVLTKADPRLRQLAMEHIPDKKDCAQSAHYQRP
jgi:(p)ppGpp synthase/HD superfamily hydrolase